jgi:uncharacterized cupin superfamily protein
MKIIDTSQLDYQPMYIRGTEELLSSFSLLHELLGLSSLHLSREILAPHHRISSSHYHTHSEECFLVLKREVVIVGNEGERTLNVGEIVAFLPEPNLFHYIRNDSGRDAELLVINSPHAKDEVVYKVN